MTARKLSVKRVWAIDDFDRNSAPELRTVIHGRALPQFGDVRVIGEDERFTEFDINMARLPCHCVTGRQASPASLARDKPAWKADIWARHLGAA